jgi:SAM-dependent methyltransferase
LIDFPAPGGHSSWPHAEARETMSRPTTAGEQGPIWSAAAPTWAELWSGLADPARGRLLDEAEVGPGTALLDLGCGSGELCALATARGARASGIDASEAMVATARRLVPQADLRVGALEDLQWPEATFDVVTAVNALQFAADLGEALSEAARVTRPGGRIGVSNWSRRAACDVNTIDDALSPPGAESAVRLPGGLERLMAEAGLRVRSAGEISVPWEAPDRATLERAFLIGAAELGRPEPELRSAIAAAAEPFRRPDGSYRLENRFRYVIAEVPGA